MKYLAYFYLIFCISAISYGQTAPYRFGLGLSSGLNIVSQGGPIAYTTSPSWGFGIYAVARYSLTKHWGIESGLSYTYKKANYQSQSVFRPYLSTPDFHHRVQYQLLSLPLRLAYKAYLPMGKVLHLQAGYDFGHLAACSQTRVYYHNKLVYQGYGLRPPKPLIVQTSAQLGIDFPYQNHLVNAALIHTWHYAQRNAYAYMPLDTFVTDAYLGVQVTCFY
jgi:hypothetical protein